MSPSELYILYAFLGFICLLLVTVIGILIRQSFAIGSIQGQLNGLATRIDRLEQEMAEFREQLANFREQLAEMRGMTRALHDRMDLLTRHHHDGDGRVVIIPEEVPAAD